ncbi:hypothetical protein [Falsiroseomonas oryzae]|uniref:hypothetical protein n=1 Tax=Falsiroseomonas oryzae TaxID=2766473 RepID=UPI0022EA5CBC|nr:hypothetical protein [Roseomonas sp. MO-31]
MTSFRLLLGGLAAVIAGPAIAQSCVQSAERTAFDVRALQSQLMVAALACGKDTEYNAFVRKFQGDLAASYRGIAAHYRRTAGGSAQRDLDQYITQLANAQSQDGIRAGSHYCPLVTPLFQQALAQSNAQGLAELAMERNVLNPLATPDCAATPARAPASTPSRSPARPAASNRSAAATR